MLAVHQQDFDAYLQLFQRQLSMSGSAVDTGARIHTVSIKHSDVMVIANEGQGLCMHASLAAGVVHVHHGRLPAMEKKVAEQAASLQRLATPVHQCNQQRLHGA